MALKKLASLLQSGAGASTTKSETPPEPTSRAWVDALFLRFTAIWPTAWADCVSAATDRESLAREWQTGLEGLNGEQIKRGVDAARIGCRWPPSIAEFRCLCTGPQPDHVEQMQAGGSYRLVDAKRLLPGKTSAERAEMARTELERMRRLLGGERAA